MSDEQSKPVRELPRNGAPKVKWDMSNMRSAYANVCNVMSTQEEVVLMFGINQAWSSGPDELTVQLNERLILSPFAAKRLAQLLGNVVEQYEARFGSLEGPPQTAADVAAIKKN